MVHYTTCRMSTSSVAALSLHCQKMRHAHQHERIGALENGVVYGFYHLNLAPSSQNNVADGVVLPIFFLCNVPLRSLSSSPGYFMMDSKPSADASVAPSPASKIIARSTPKDRDFLNHLEAYLAKRDGVDKLLKISRYATKIILSSSALPETLTLTRRLKSFESSVGLSRKAFRLGKFVQDVNALRNSHFDSKQEILLSIIAYGGEGLYYFVEQFVWLAKSGLIDGKHARNLGKISAWAEFIGYLGSLSLKFRDLKKLTEDEVCLESSIEVAVSRGNGCGEEEEKLRKLREKKLMKKLSIVQDFADGLMALADIRDGKGRLSAPFVVSCAGLLSALISTHKNWVSC